mmetsp:Transcript_3267/g.7665  ORF Transcript_3267/g.7665 Transcript_3267/m.7665 type:complete len:541 (+) Transcript_3267:668-2290(+)
MSTTAAAPSSDQSAPQEQQAARRLRSIIHDMHECLTRGATTGVNHEHDLVNYYVDVHLEFLRDTTGKGDRRAMTTPIPITSADSSASTTNFTPLPRFEATPAAHAEADSASAANNTRPQKSTTTFSGIKLPLMEILRQARTRNAGVRRVRDFDEYEGEYSDEEEFEEMNMLAWLREKAIKELVRFEGERKRTAAEKRKAFAKRVERECPELCKMFKGTREIFGLDFRRLNSSPYESGSPHVWCRMGIHGRQPGEAELSLGGALSLPDFLAHGGEQEVYPSDRNVVGYRTDDFWRKAKLVFFDKAEQPWPKKGDGPFARTWWTEDFAMSMRHQQQADELRSKQGEGSNSTSAPGAVTDSSMDGEQQASVPPGDAPTSHFHDDDSDFECNSGSSDNASFTERKKWQDTQKKFSSKYRSQFALKKETYEKEYEERLAEVWERLWEGDRWGNKLHERRRRPDGRGTNFKYSHKLSYRRTRCPFSQFSSISIFPGEPASQTPTQHPHTHTLDQVTIRGRFSISWLGVSTRFRCLLLFRLGTFSRL